MSNTNAGFDGGSVLFGFMLGVVLMFVVAAVVAYPSPEEQVRAVRGAYPDAEVVRVSATAFFVQGEDGCVGVEVMAILDTFLTETEVECPVNRGAETR